jgi:hypothetical protein
MPLAFGLLSSNVHERQFDANTRSLNNIRRFFDQMNSTEPAMMLCGIDGS